MAASVEEKKIRARKEGEGERGGRRKERHVDQRDENGWNADRRSGGNGGNAEGLAGSRKTEGRSLEGARGAA